MSHKQKRFLYLLLFFLLLCIEILIGLFVHDRFIRPYIGDVFVIVLLCCFVRILLPTKPVGLGLYMILAGVTAELLQLIQLDALLHIDGTWLGVIFGSTFDLRDILCYAVGGGLFFASEQCCKAIARRRER